MQTEEKKVCCGKCKGSKEDEVLHACENKPGKIVNTSETATDEKKPWRFQYTMRAH